MSTSANRVLLAVLATSAIGQGAGESLRVELASSLADSLASRDSGSEQLAASDSTRLLIPHSLEDVVRSACPQHFRQCVEDKACAEELSGLADGTPPISEHAQALVQCAEGAVPKFLLDLHADAASGAYKGAGPCVIA